ncbi:hypothetical protein KBZ21_41190, partial [Streptomyces sp. A73]|nr:hypothetical protein [Streptomyces sp. A73]
EIVATLHSHGLRLHGFGVKTQGLSDYGPSLYSADSMAWSVDGPPWCTAAWAPLDATNEAEAQDEKARRWGDAQFFHQLPAE